jgi:hypothetical protein
VGEKEWTLYQRVLDFLRLRKRAYQLTFQQPKTNEVLKDLAKFCYANETPKCGDLYRLGVAAGRREVWLRIMRHLNLQPDELYEIYSKPSSIQLKGD